MKTELVPSISKRDLGSNDVAGREEEEEGKEEVMAGHCAVPQPGEVNRSWVWGCRRNGNLTFPGKLELVRRCSEETG